MTHGVLQSVIVEYDCPSDNQIYTTSSLLFSERYVLVTANILMPYLKTLNSDLASYLKTFQPGTLHFKPFSTKNGPHFTIVSKIDMKTKTKFDRAQVIAGFVCRNVLNSCQKYLRDWAIDFEKKTYEVKDFLSLFFVLELDRSEGEQNKQQLIAALIELLATAEGCQLSIGLDVFTESIPFGHRAFMGSYSRGIISNVIGENSCFILTDCPTVPGSEGSPIYLVRNDKEQNIIGIIVSCLNWWRGEWIGLTLCVNLVSLLSEIVSTSPGHNSKNNYYMGKISPVLSSSTANSLIQIVSGSGWGTGICINKAKGIFLTNSHVIESEDDITLYWQNEQIKLQLLYKTPNLNAYDLAVLQCNSTIKHLAITEIRMSLQPPKLGEEVYAAGFPLFSRELKPKVTLTKGHVSQINKFMMKTSCCVLPGSSGGGIFRPDGQLLAIIVSNARLDNVGVVYPRVNMAIPILAVYSTFEKFFLTGEVAHLSNLYMKGNRDCENVWMGLSSKL